MGNRRRSAERLQAFKDKIRLANAIGSSSRMDLYNDMFFDISFRISKLCSMHDAISNTEIFKIEYQRYCMHLSSGISELITFQPNLVGLPEDDSEVDHSDEVSPRETEDSDELALDSESFCSLQECSESLDSPDVLHSINDDLPILQPIVTVVEDQRSFGRSVVNEGLVTGFFEKSSSPSFDVSRVAIQAELNEKKRKAVSQAPATLEVLNLCEPYLDCRSKLVVKLACPAVKYRRPQCRERGTVVPIMDPSILKINGVHHESSSSRTYAVDYFGSESVLAKRSSRCICCYPWTLSYFSEEMVITREIVNQLSRRYKSSVPILDVNITSVNSPVFVALVSRKLGDSGAPTFMVSDEEYVSIRSGGYIIFNVEQRQRLVTHTHESTFRRQSL